MLDDPRLRRIGAASDEAGLAAAFAAVQVLLHKLTAQDRFTIAVRVATGPGSAPAADAVGSTGRYDGFHAVSCAVTAAMSFRTVTAAASAALRHPGNARPSSVVTGADGAEVSLVIRTGDLSLSIAAGPEHLAIIVDYDADLFEPLTIRRWFEAYHRLLAEAVDDPGRAIGMLLWSPQRDLANVPETEDATAAGVPDRWVPPVADPTRAVHHSAEASGPSRLSLTQERMWLLEAMDPHQMIVHNLPFAWQFEGALDVDALERSLSSVVKRHETMRTRIIVRDGVPLQDVVFDAALALAKVDLTGLPEDRRDAAALGFCERESRTPQELASAPLVRATLIRTAEDRHILLIVPHNLIWDARSSEIFLRDLTTFYAAETEGAPADPPALPITYRDFARWQREWLEGADAGRHRAWWSATLAGQLPVLQLPDDRPRPVDQTRDAVHVASSLSRAQMDTLAAVGRGSGATLFTVLVAALAVLLHRVSGQDDVIVGVPVGARTRPETEYLLGPFLNLMVLRSRIERSTTFRELMALTSNRMLDVLSHQELPIEAADARAPILRAFFTFEEGSEPTAQMGALRVSTVPMMPAAVETDVRLSATVMRDGLSVAWTCSADLFDQSTVRRLHERFAAVLDAVVRDPDQRVADIELMAGEERALLQTFVDAEAPVDADVCVHTLVERHAARTPADAAVVFGDEVIDYGSLDRQSNAVARALDARGVGHGSTVAVCLARSAEFVVSLLGIMKAGAVCVPLDPADPPSRITAILEHSGASVILTDWARRRQLPQQPLPIVCVDEAVVPSSACGYVESAVPDSLEATACLLYACEARQLRATPVSHGTLASLLGSFRRELALTQQDVALAIAPTSLDVSIVELLAPLSAAACVMIADDDVALDSDRLMAAVGRSATVMIAPTPVWGDLLGEAGVTWPRLKAVCYGARPPRSAVTELCARTASAWFAHGVTPAGIWTTMHRLSDKDVGDVIGRPLANAALRLAGPDGRDQPIGIVGELRLRLKSPARVAAGGGETPEPTDRTGLQARWRGDGAVELMSSRPREVYIDGFRINLDDVGEVIRRHEKVEDAEAMLDTSAAPARLVAWIVPREGASYSVSELRRDLRRSVPAAMVPRSFVEVGSIPRLPGGTAPSELLGVVRAGAGGGYVAPDTPTERMVAELWADAIGIPRVGVHDNFFALGGHSLLCFQVLDRLERKTGLRVSPRRLLLDTLRQVASHIDGMDAGRARPDGGSRHSGAGMFQRLRHLLPRSG